MKKNLFVLFASVLLFASLSVSAQNVKVSGTVSDANGPLAGAVVMVKGTTNGTATDVNGEYSLNADSKAILEVSCLGYKTVEEAVNGRAVINVVLGEDTEMLQDVVVLGYGAATKKKDLSAAVGVVATPEELAKRPVTSTQALLQGQIPGVTVQADGGSPTSTPSVVVRGQGSRNGDSVLWVVDGVPGAPINNVSDIESIVVLKDAASAAIYGAQSGAGGVILVTTKKGTKGVSLSYDGLVGVRSATNLPTPLNAEQQIEMRKQSYANAGLTMPEGWNVAKNPWVGTTRTNWMDEVFRDALYHRHNVVINAGTDKFKNRISASFENNDGVVVNTFNKKFGINYRGSYDINKWIRITEDFNWNTGQSKGANTDSDQTGVILMALNMPASASVYRAIYNQDGTYSYDNTLWGGTCIEDANYVNKYGQWSSIHSDCVNPVHEQYRDNTFNRTSNLMSTTALELGNFENIKGLKFVSRFTYFHNQNFYKNFNETRPEIGKPSLSNSLNYSASVSEGWKTENTLTYDRTFGKHTVGALVSTTADRQSNRGFSASASGFEDQSQTLQYFNWSSSYSKPTDYLNGPDANVAVIARLSYSFNDRYFVTASWRRDYAGRLPDGHNYGDFPAVTGAWKISSEPFFKKQDAVTLLKLRASWGRVGNLGSIGWNYKSPTLSQKGWNNQSVQYGYETAAGYCGQFYFNGKALNPNLTWETSEQLDFGIDAAFLRDRLDFSVDVYNKRTFNLIQDQTSGWPNSIGMDAMKVNQGEITNRGVELQLGWHDKVGNWSYSISGNAAYNKNWVSDIGVTNSDGTKGVWTGGGAWGSVNSYMYQTAEGQPLNSFYVIKCLGIFQSEEDVYDHVHDGKLIQPNAQPGDLKFEDFNNDGKIDDKDRQYVGSATPDWTFALNGSVTWKDLTLSLMFQGVQGAQAAHMAKNQMWNENEVDCNREVRILDAWTPENTHSVIPRMSQTDNNGNWTTASTYYLEDASYIRLKSLTLSYDITSALRKATHFGERGSSLLVYFSGENLFTITKYTGMDPECGGFDGFKYPVSRVLSLGLKLTY